MGRVRQPRVRKLSDQENLKQKNMNQIAVDGPAGAGKSTVAKEVSRRLGFMYVDTGAMYRTIGLECLKQGVDVNDEGEVAKVCASSKIKIKYIGSVQHMYIGPEDVSGQIRTQRCAAAASAVARYESVRTKLVALQRQLGNEYDVVMDGRDIGTCVLPDAGLKIFLTASVQCRALRRFNELKEKGTSCSLDEIKSEIEKRDYEDSHRKISPLKKADDAVYLDTSEMTVDEAADAVIEQWKLS